jgi:hypothetical protein
MFGRALQEGVLQTIGQERGRSVQDGLLRPRPSKYANSTDHTISTTCQVTSRDNIVGRCSFKVDLYVQNFWRSDFLQPFLALEFFIDFNNELTDYISICRLTNSPEKIIMHSKFKLTNNPR